MALDTAVGSEDNSRELTLKLSGEMVDEIERIGKITGINPRRQFQRGYTLLRVIIDAYEEGKEVYVVDRSGERCNKIVIPGYNAD